MRTMPKPHARRYRIISKIDTGRRPKYVQHAMVDSLDTARALIESDYPNACIQYPQRAVDALNRRTLAARSVAEPMPPAYDAYKIGACPVVPAHGLPPAAATLNPVDSRAVVIVRNACSGYWPIHTFPQADDSIEAYKTAVDHARCLMASINEALGVTPAQREALFAGSMWGFDAPAANPDYYDHNGNIRRPSKV